jgi:hypothetical protein
MASLKEIYAITDTIRTAIQNDTMLMFDWRQVRRRYDELVVELAEVGGLMLEEETRWVTPKAQTHPST